MRAPSKEQFYADLNAGTWCGWDWCRKLYGYQVTDPEFLGRVYARLDELGRGRVKYIYSLYVKLEIAHELKQMEPVGRRLREESDKNYERKVKKTEWQEKEDLLARRNQLLMQKLQK